MKVKTSGHFLLFFLITTLFTSTNSFAYSSCEEACTTAADESGRNDYPYDSGGEISCCCIDSGNGFESRPLQECENL